MASPLVAKLKDELRLQRTFLSSDEETALTRPLSYQDEDDLAFDRVKHRRLFFHTALRSRFINDGRPTAEWRRLVAEEEAAAGNEPTVTSHLATQVLEWAARTSDRGAMLGGFAARALRWAGMLAALLGAWGWWHGAPFGGAVFAAVGFILLVAGRIVGGLAAARVARLAEQVRASASLDEPDADLLAGYPASTVAPADRLT